MASWRWQRSNQLTVCPALLLRCSAATSKALSVAPPLPSGCWRSATVATSMSWGREPRCCRNSSSSTHTFNHHSNVFKCCDFNQEHLAWGILKMIYWKQSLGGGIGGLCLPTVSHSSNGLDTIYFICFKLFTLEWSSLYYSYLNSLTSDNKAGTSDNHFFWALRSTVTLE